MSELEQRWRLVLGKYSDQQFPPLGLEGAGQDQALAFLYDRLYQNRGFRDEGGGGDGQERSAGLESSVPHLVDWLNRTRELFPEEVAQSLTAEAVERFGLTELLTDPTALDHIEADIHTLQMLLSLKSNIDPAALSAVRRIVQRVVDELMERLRSEISAVIVGRVDPQSRTRRPTGAVDALRTIERNLGTWDADRRRLLIEDVTFFRRTRLRYPWEIILCIDQSGSMANSVIHSAVLAGILSGLPGVSVRLVAFDTAVADLTDLADDPVEALMSVQLGGGTDIAQAVRYVESLVTNPTRTIVALITDFFEGGSVPSLLQSVSRLAESGATLMGLAALEDGGGPAFDRNTAERVVAAGMPVGAMTPKSFAQWAAGIMQ